MIHARLARDPSVLLLGPVRGVAEEATRLAAALEAFGPAAIGIGLSEEERQGLLDYFVLSEAEPVVPLTNAEVSEVRGLVRFGEVRVPNPSFVETLRWGGERGVPVEALDPTDDAAASLFTEHIGYFELVRRTVRERQLSRSPPSPSTADEFALAWDREVSGGRGSRDFARARDAYLVRAVSGLRATRSPVAVVVDRERFESVRALLEAGPTRTAEGF